MFIYAELLSVPLKLAIFKEFVYLTVGENAVPRWGTALNNHIKFAAALEVITSVVHYSVRLEGGSRRPKPFSGQKGEDFFLSHQSVSLFCSVSIQHTNTEFSKSSLHSPRVFFPLFFPTACSLPPSWTDILEETYAASPTSQQLVLAEWKQARREEAVGRVGEEVEWHTE